MLSLKAKLRNLSSSQMYAAIRETCSQQLDNHVVSQKCIFGAVIAALVANQWFMVKVRLSCKVLIQLMTSICQQCL